jgi:hypothetical protein
MTLGETLSKARAHLDASIEVAIDDYEALLQQHGATADELVCRANSLQEADARLGTGTTHQTEGMARA